LGQDLGHGSTEATHDGVLLHGDDEPGSFGCSDDRFHVDRLNRRDVKHMRVPELSHPKRLLHLAQAMHQRGYKTPTIEKFLGGNYFRVFQEVVG